MFNSKPRLHSLSGADALTAAFDAFFPGSLLELGRRTSEFRAQIRLAPLGKITLFSGRYGNAFRVQMPNSSHFIQGLPVRGRSESVNNRIVTVASPETGTIAEPGEVSFSTRAEFEHLVVLLNPEALNRTLAAVIGTPISRRLRLDLLKSSSPPKTRLFRGLVKLLMDELDAVDEVPSPLVLAELEQAIMVAFLAGSSHNYSHLLDGRNPDAAHSQVRKVEEYIEANWDRPVSFEALAAVAHTSARSIFRSFRRHRGYTPMDFVKQVRIRHAHEMLCAGNPEMTVTMAAFACGFSNLGHFAADYLRAFGENPSATLQRAKSRTGI
jgi:AraC-like DNA-binding protein